MKEIVLADTMGFCWGVRRTLNIVRESNASSKPIAMLGDVIHNPQVVEELEELGVHSVESIEAATAQGFTRIGVTAHGTVPGREREVRSRGLEFVDTTCPLVTRVQRLAEKLVRQGYYLVIYGDASHPETIGIYGWANTSRATVTREIDDLPWSSSQSPNGVELPPPPRKVAIVSQTTKNSEEFLAFAHEVVDLIIPTGGEVRVCNTICEPTMRRQAALRDLSRQVDAVIVVGGAKSSNTARLAEVGRGLGTPSYRIERPEELEDHWLHEVDRVGITAGASTPDQAILAVLSSLEYRGYVLADSRVVTQEQISRAVARSSE
jgi:4-hydroxy-3-methylbut-2-enyl diphosphate reductase